MAKRRLNTHYKVRVALTLKRLPLYFPIAHKSVAMDDVHPTDVAGTSVPSEFPALPSLI